MKNDSAKARYIKELTVLTKTKEIDSEWMIPIKIGLDEFEEINPECTYEEIIEQFGDPEKVLADHLDAISYTEKSNKKPRIRVILLILILAAILGISGFIIYNVIRINVATGEYVVLDVNENPL